MGDFVICRREKTDEESQRAILRTLDAQGSKNPAILKTDSYNILIFKKSVSPLDNLYQNDNGDFCASSGCFFYKGKSGKQALENFLTDFDPEEYSPYGFLGIFSLIIKKSSRLYLLTDPMGGSKIFRNSDHSLFSSSFLAVAENTGPLSIDKQGVYEYCFQETNYGRTTPFNELKTLDRQCNFELGPNGIKKQPKNIPLDFECATEPYDKLIERHSELLQNQMRQIVASHGKNISTALSGGYDTRLMLSLLLKSGVKPDLYVYGADNSADVRVAKNIAAGEGFALKHINKAEYTRPSPENYPATIKDNFYALDGYPLEGIFNFGANMATRRERAENGALVLNGGGGEIYRNFFYLPDRDYSVNDLINAFYSHYTRSFCTKEFNEKTYRENLRTKIMTALNLETDSMSRAQLEYAYPAFRLRYWTARDNNNNTRLGGFLTPFISYETIMAALKIPLKYKTHGKFQGDLINNISPSLAAYNSDYGYAFNAPVPWAKKLKNNMTIYRPAVLRRYSYAVQQKFATLNLPHTLNPEYIAQLFPHGPKYMNEYFNLLAIKDAALLGRVLTLEYLCGHLEV